MTEDDYPRSMRDPVVRERRRAMLAEPHIVPLTAYAAKLRERGSIEVPEFDPLDGGIRAQALFLFEKPGPKTANELGSGFISRNNDDPSAEATFNFMQRAQIPRKLTVTWNVIPWWNGTRTINRDELKDGIASLHDLITLLPNLKAVLVGNKAAKARPLLTDQSNWNVAQPHRPHPGPHPAHPIPRTPAPNKCREASRAPFIPLGAHSCAASPRMSGEQFRLCACL